MLTSADHRAGVGMHAGWALTFHREGLDGLLDAETVLSSDRYDAEIEASLPGGLQGGLYTVTLVGLTDADHRAIATDIDAGAPSVMKLHLFWYDTTGGIGAYLANVTDLTAAFPRRARPRHRGGGESSPDELADRLVAVLAVSSVRRRPGATGYETVVTGRERVFDRLSARVRASMCMVSPKAIIEEAAEQAGLSGALQFHDGFDAEGQLPASGSSDLGTAMVTFTRGRTFAQELAEVASATETATGRFGRGVLLIRDGTLHVGVRAGPLGTDDTLPLTPSTGLVEVIADGATGGAEAPEDRGGTVSGPPKRRRWTLLCKGRPDLKPGHVVAFDRPPSESAATTPTVGQAVAGPLRGPILPGLRSELMDPLLLYVDSVSHRLGPKTGFVTTITGVEVTKSAPAGRFTADDLYDPPAPAGPEVAEQEGGGAEGAERATRALRHQLRRALEDRRLTVAGEVRTTTASGAGSVEEPPGHTSTVWRGLVDSDGRPNRLARLPVLREAPDVRQRVPHVTPFAWGHCGLVVPRYPGTRVVLSHGNGSSDDPVDLGALWQSGQGPDAQPGDWWLILPVGVPEARRSALADEEIGDPHTGPVTQDLVDADGNRVIEVGELTIRVTRDALAAAGTRPERARDADSVTIEHADAGSRIVMTSDGTIRIQGSRIELDAGDGEITMTAGTVDVSVNDAMNVS